MQQDTAAILFERARLNAENGDLRGALEAIQQIMAAGWVSADLASFKAFLENALRRPGMAERSLQLAVGIEPDHWPSFALLAEMRLRRYDLAGAETAIAEASRIEPNNPYNYVLSARLLAIQAIAFENRNLIDSAVLQWDKAIRLAPESTETKCIYAEFLLHHGRLSAARVHANAALAQRPEWDTPHALLAAIHIADGRLQEAGRHLEEIERLNPANPALPRLKAEIKHPGARLLGKWMRWSNWIFRDATRTRAITFAPIMMLVLTFFYGADALWWLALCFVSAIPLILARIGLWLKRRQLS